MSQSLDLTNIREFMKRHVVNVFETMLSMTAVPCADCNLKGAAERISSSVGFGGDTVTGVAYLHLSGQFANGVAAAILALAPDTVSAESEVNDVVGELSNMLIGGLKSHLCDMGFPCAVSTPTIIRGTSFDIESMQDIERMCLAFQCGADCCVVEIHVKTNKTG